MKQLLKRLLWLLIVLIVFSAGFPIMPAAAASFTASDAATLISAINTANVNGEANTITLTANIALTTTNNNDSTNGANGLPVITSAITINGGGYTLSRADGSASFRLFRVASGGNLTLNFITLSGGFVSSSSPTINPIDKGGAILNQGTVTIQNTTIQSNSTSGSFADGGAVYNNGTMTVNASTFLSNTTPARGGAIFNNANRTLTMNNSTFDLNTSGSFGSAIIDFGSVTITNSTIANNASSVSNGGAFSDAGGNSRVYNTIITSNTNGNCRTAPTTGSNNISAGSDCGATFTVSATINLQPLASNGGYTQTHMLGAGSSAINAGSNAQATAAGLTADQNGNARVVGGTVDIGSTESSSSVPSVTINPSSLSVPEGTSGDFTVSRGAPNTNALIVTLNISLGANTTASDYTLSAVSAQSGNGVTVTIPANQASVTITFTANEDTPAEPDNTLTLTLVDDALYDLGSPSAATATIPANDLVVTTLANTGEGSLRQAVANANAFASNDEITFQITGTITLASTLSLANNGTLTITGSLANVISGGGSVQVFSVVSGANVTLNTLTVTSGRGNTGGGINNNSGTLTVNDSVLSDNYTDFLGGGIYNSGTLTLNRTMLTNNDAGLLGGGIYNTASVTLNDSTISGSDAQLGAGIYSSGSLTLDGTTLSGNTVTNNGGGIYSSGTLTITDSVVIGNTAASEGDGIYSLNAGSISNTCIVNNGDTAVTNVSGTITANGNWWGTTWGPNIPSAPADSGSFVSTGDSINGNGRSNSLVNVGINVVPADYGTDSTSPTGNWLTAPPFPTCPVCDEVSSVGHTRVCDVP